MSSEYIDYIVECRPVNGKKWMYYSHFSVSELENMGYNKIEEWAEQRLPSISKDFPNHYFRILTTKQRMLILIRD